MSQQLKDEDFVSVGSKHPRLDKDILVDTFMIICLVALQFFCSCSHTFHYSLFIYLYIFISFYFTFDVTAGINLSQFGIKVVRNCSNYTHKYCFKYYFSHTVLIHVNTLLVSPLYGPTTAFTAHCELSCFCFHFILSYVVKY